METSKADKKKIDDLIHRIGLKYHLSDEIVREIVNCPYLFTYETIKELDLEEVTTEEELNEIKTNFYYKGLGKLHIPFGRISRRIKQRENAQKVNKRRWKN